MKLFLRIAFCLIFISVFYYANSEAVCSEYELIEQLKEDLADNGKLDCLRESLPVPGESNEDKIKRLQANWEGDCSFESDNQDFPWPLRLTQNYPLVRGLVDVNGVSINDTNQPE